MLFNIPAVLYNIYKMHYNEILEQQISLTVYLTKGFNFTLQRLPHLVTARLLHFRDTKVRI